MTPGDPAPVEVRWLSAFLDHDAADHDAAVAFWTTVTGSSLSAPRDGGRFVTLLPPDGEPYLRAQRLDDGPSRLHLDLHVDDPRAAAATAAALGAHQVADHGHVLMTSPGGLPFCFVHAGPTTPSRPRPLDHPDGTTSLVDQVCLDIPSGVHETEVAFWAALTGWERRASPVDPAMSSLVRPPHRPVRLLLQRLGEPGGPGSPVRAHLDLSCSDRAAETARHVDLGARVTAVHAVWTVLVDPVGSPYCVTDRDPETGMLDVGGAR